MGHAYKFIAKSCGGTAPAPSCVKIKAEMFRVTNMQTSESTVIFELMLHTCNTNHVSGRSSDACNIPIIARNIRPVAKEWCQTFAMFFAALHKFPLLPRVRIRQQIYCLWGNCQQAIETQDSKIEGSKTQGVRHCELL